MTKFEYDKDFPFAAFITNLGKYNEGELVGEWVKFPVDSFELSKVFKRIGIGSVDDFGCIYEEWFITDYDCYVDGLYDKLGEYSNLDELNYLAAKLTEMSEDEYLRFKAALEVSNHTGSISELINITENLDCYFVYPEIENYDDLGRYCIEELETISVPDNLKNYLDFEAYGRDVAMGDGGDFTDGGYVISAEENFHTVYDGNCFNIPPEHRIMLNAYNETNLEVSSKDIDYSFKTDIDDNIHSLSVRETTSNSYNISHGSFDKYQSMPIEKAA